MIKKEKVRETKWDRRKGDKIYENKDRDEKRRGNEEEETGHSEMMKGVEERKGNRGHKTEKNK